MVGPSRNRLLLRLLGRERFLEVVARRRVYHVTEVLRASSEARGATEVTPRRGAVEFETPRRTGMPKMTSAMYTTMPMVIHVAAPTPV